MNTSFILFNKFDMISEHWSFLQSSAHVKDVFVLMHLFLGIKRLKSNKLFRAKIILKTGLKNYIAASWSQNIGTSFFIPALINIKADI